MGFGANEICFLHAAREGGVSFARTVMLGRQRLHLSQADLRRSCARMDAPLDAAEADALFKEADGYADPFLRRLGAGRIDTMDASTYEGATIVHDLNAPLPDDLRQRFTVVIDGGTLEHVFNVPVALSSCMRMLEVGGHFLGISPANNYMGHGFYQFSPELFYRVFSEANGFQVESMYVYEGAFTPRFRWYEVKDPSVVRRRVTLEGGVDAMLLVRARKLRDVMPFAQAPQQSDYEASWESAAGGAAGAARQRGLAGAAKTWLVRQAPGLVVRGQRIVKQFSEAVRFDSRTYARVDVRGGVGRLPASRASRESE
jgi:hypothetical protein